MEVATWYELISMSAVNHQVCLSLGSNIEAKANILKAVELLKEQLTILMVSSVWESASADCCYPDFLNLSMLVSTSLEARPLKQQLLRPLEARMGRVRTADKNAARPIDIDIILYDGKVLDPDLWRQVYLAIPISELFPDIQAKNGERLIDVAMRLRRSNYIKLRKDISISLA